MQKSTALFVAAFLVAAEADDVFGQSVAQVALESMIGVDRAYMVLSKATIEALRA